MRKVFALSLLAFVVLTACGVREEGKLSSETEKKIIHKTIQQEVESEKNQSASAAKKSEAGEKDVDFISEMEYSNLLDQETKEYVKKQLINAGIRPDSVEEFFSQVDDFYSVVEHKGFVEKGFKKTKELLPVYDQAGIVEAWDLAKAHFIGNNCRITTFGLLKDLIAIGNPKGEKDITNLMMDEDSLRENSVRLFDEEEKECFLTLFSNIKTESGGEIVKHIANLKKDWKKKQIRFAEHTKATMISVVFHSSFSEEENNLFIGHVGVLVPTDDGKWLFIEKIAFDEPYQAILFQHKIEVSDFLMNRYDNEWDQPTAPPFVMENDSLIEGYRRKPREKK